jgi:hypothetical protein
MLTNKNVQVNVNRSVDYVDGKISLTANYSITAVDIPENELPTDEELINAIAALAINK